MFLHATTLHRVSGWNACFFETPAPVKLHPRATSGEMSFFKMVLVIASLDLPPNEQ